MFSTGFLAYLNYLVLFFIFLVIYGLMASLFYYSRRLDFESIKVISVLSVVFVLIKIVLDYANVFIRVFFDLSPLIYLIDAFCLILLSHYLDVPQRYLRRISCIFVSVILAVILYDLTFLLLASLV